MMTTDTVAKVARRSVGDAVIVGVAKGVGMIEPDMATLLTWIFTDAQVDRRLARPRVPQCARALVQLAVDRRRHLDLRQRSGVRQRGGRAGRRASIRHGARARCASTSRCRSPATVRARPSCSRCASTARATSSSAKRVAKSIVNSPLVKTAVHGADPNWGRVAMAIGKVEDDDLGPDTTTIRFGDLEVYPKALDDSALDALSAIMRADHVARPRHAGHGPGAVHGVRLRPEPRVHRDQRRLHDLTLSPRRPRLGRHHDGGAEQRADRCSPRAPPIFASVTITGSSNASSATNSDTVKPMPAIDADADELRAR